MPNVASYDSFSCDKQVIIPSLGHFENLLSNLECGLDVKQNTRLCIVLYLALTMPLPEILQLCDLRKHTELTGDPEYVKELHVHRDKFLLVKITTSIPTFVL